MCRRDACPTQVFGTYCSLRGVLRLARSVRSLRMTELSFSGAGRFRPSSSRARCETSGRSLPGDLRSEVAETCGGVAFRAARRRGVLAVRRRRRAAKKSRIRRADPRPQQEIPGKRPAKKKPGRATRRDQGKLYWSWEAGASGDSPKTTPPPHEPPSHDAGAGVGGTSVTLSCPADQINPRRGLRGAPRCSDSPASARRGGR